MNVPQALSYPPVVPASPGVPPPWVYFPATAVAPPRRADAVSMLTEMFRAWGKDLPAYLGLFLLAGILTAALNVAVFWYLLGVPWITAQALLNLPAALGPNFAVTYALMNIALALVGAVLTAWFSSTVTYFAIRKRRGQPCTWTEAARTGTRRFPSVVVGTLLLDGILGVVTSLDSVLTVSSAQNPVSPTVLAAACGILLVFPLFLFLWIALFLYAPVAVMEGAGGVASLRRSWVLTRGRRLNLFGALLLMGVVAAVVYVPTLFVPAMLGISLVSLVGQVASTMLVGAWQILMAAVAYELIGEEERDLQARQAFFRPAVQPP